MYAVDHARKLLFITPYKSGSSSVRTLLKGMVESGLLVEDVQRMVDNGYKVVCNIRDPWQRLPSAHANKFPSLKFNALMDSVLRNTDPYLDPHLRSQSFWLDLLGNPEVDYFLRVGPNMAADWERLRRDYPDLPGPMIHKNQSERTKNPYGRTTMERLKLFEYRYHHDFALWREANDRAQQHSS
jgi:hypothetical protein